MAITTSNITKALKAGLVTMYGKAYKDIPMQRSLLCKMISSNDAFEEFMNWRGTGLARRLGEGEAVQYTDMQEGFILNVRHSKYALGLDFTQEAIDDDKIGLLTDKGAKDLAKSMAHTQEQSAFNLLNNAVDTNYTYADGKPAMATDHPLVGGGTFSNRAAADADFSEALVESLLTQMAYWVDEGGLYMMANAKKIFGAFEQRFEFARVLKNPNRPATMDRDINAAYELGLLDLQPVLSPFITDVDSTYITTDVDQGLVFATRKEPVITMDNAFDNDVVLAKVVARWLTTVVDPRGLIGAIGA